MHTVDIIVGMLGSTIRLSIPLIFTALAGLFSERSGIFDIGLEGKMLASAFASAVVAYYTGSPWLGLLGGILVSILFSLVHGYASITARGNQIVSGVALNFVAAGLTVVLGNAWFRQGGRTPQLANTARFTEIEFPGAEAAREMGFLGKFYADVISGQNVLVYLAFITVPIVWWVIYKTRFGLRLRAVGENPEAARHAGIPVTATFLRVALLSGGLAGLAGVGEVAGLKGYLTADLSPGFGYAGIVVAMLAGLSPVGAVVAALFIAGVFVGADSMSRAIGVSNYLADLVVATSLICVLVSGLFVRFKVRIVRPGTGRGTA